MSRWEFTPHKHKDFSSLPETPPWRCRINTTNLSRALFLLQAQKLIKLDPKFTDPATTLATPKDIVENPKHLKILEIESPQIPRSLDDVDLAVINGNYALEAGPVCQRRMPWGWKAPSITRTPIFW